MAVDSAQPPAAVFRYVVLRHEGHGEAHLDLMFETSPSALLRTWRAEGWPPPAGQRLIELPAHRRAYLDYEGPVSGGRGHVQRISAGTYRLVAGAPDRFIAHCSDGTVLDLKQESSGTWRCEPPPSICPQAPS